MIIRSALLVALLFALSPSVGHAAESVILIPTLHSGPGAFGSSWWSSVIINNHSSSSFTSPGVTFRIGCGIGLGCDSPAIGAGQMGVVSEPRPSSGVILRGDASVLSQLAFQARFGQGLNYLTNGTELPIVREAQFGRSPMRFPYVTLHLTREPVRSMLRIYGPDAVVGTSVRVELRPWYLPSELLQASLVIELRVPPQPENTVMFPAYAQVWLQQQFPFEQLQGSSFNISVVPLPLPSGEVPRIWAFVSTTENNSQQVTVHTPQ